jgi:hypothetical protein
MQIGERDIRETNSTYKSKGPKAKTHWKEDDKTAMNSLLAVQLRAAFSTISSCCLLFLPATVRLLFCNTNCGKRRAYVSVLALFVEVNGV